MPTHSSQRDESEAFVKRQTRRRRVAAAAIGVCAVVITVASLAVLLDRDPVAGRVLIAVQIPPPGGAQGAWWSEGGMVSALFADTLSEDLETLGLESIPGGHPDVLETMEGAHDTSEIVARALELDAAHVVVGTLRPTLINALSPDLQEVRVRGAIEVIDTAAWSNGGGAVIEIDETGASGSFEGASRFAAEAAAHHSAGSIASKMCGLPALQRAFAESGRTRREIELGEKLRDLGTFCADSPGRWDERATMLRDNARRQQEMETGAIPIHAVSSIDEERYLLAVLPSDSGVVVTFKPHIPYLTPLHQGIRFWSPHERVEVMGLEGAPLSTAVSAYNLFSFPGVAVGAKEVVFVTDDHGAFMSLRRCGLDRGAPEDLAGTTVAVEQEDYISFPVPSVSGRRILFRHRTCRSCASGLEVIDADGTERRVLVEPSPTVGVGQVQWVGDSDHDLIYEVRRPDGPPVLYRRDLGDETPRMVLSGHGEQRFADVSLSRDGTLLVFVAPDGEARRLATMDLDSTEVTLVSEAMVVGEPELSADLAWIAFEISGGTAPGDRDRRDTEIAVMPRGGGALRFVTVNSVRDRNPMFAPDRSRVFFETEHREPQTGDPRMRVRWADID